MSELGRKSHPCTLISIPLMSTPLGKTWNAPINADIYTLKSLTMKENLSVAPKDN